MTLRELHARLGEIIARCDSADISTIDHAMPNMPVAIITDHGRPARIVDEWPYQLATLPDADGFTGLYAFPLFATFPATIMDASERFPPAIRAATARVRIPAKKMKR